MRSQQEYDAAEQGLADARRQLELVEDEDERKALATDLDKLAADE